MSKEYNFRLKEDFKVINDPKIIQQKNVMRESLRNEYYRKLYNPYRNATGAGGVPFDPQIQRWVSMNHTQLEYFKPTPKTTFYGFLAFFALPIVLCAVVIPLREKQERKLRSGLVSYKDRGYKFV